MCSIGGRPRHPVGEPTSTKMVKRKKRTAAEIAEASAKRQATAAAKAANFKPGKRLLKPRQILEKIPVGKTVLYQEFVSTGRIKLVRIGKRTVVAREEHVDRLIDELVDAA